MLPVRILFTGIIVTVVLLGCGKKKVQEEITDIPSLETSSVPDIFDEFYKDETETQEIPEPKKTEKPAKVKYSSPSASYSSAEISESGRYVLQVSTIKSRVFADEIAAKLNEKGFPAYIAEVNDPTPQLPGKYYRVRIGYFQTVSAARNYGESVLNPAGYDYWVDNKSNDNVGIEGYGMGEGAYYGTPSSSSSYMTTPAPVASEPQTIQTEPVSPVTSTPADVPPAPAATPSPEISTSVEPAASSPAPSTPEPEPAPEPAPAQKESGSNQWGDEEWESEWK